MGRKPQYFCAPSVISAGLWDSTSGMLYSEANRKEGPAMYEIEFVRGHVEVYLDGAFCFSADTWGEAEREIAEMTA